MVTKIVFRYWVGTTSCEDIFLQSKCNFYGEEPDLSFKYEAYLYSISLFERHGKKIKCF
jgi:hypothetical protein